LSPDVSLLYRDIHLFLRLGKRGKKNFRGVRWSTREDLQGKKGGNNGYVIIILPSSLRESHLDIEALAKRERSRSPRGQIPLGETL